MNADEMPLDLISAVTAAVKRADSAFNVGQLTGFKATHLAIAASLAVELWCGDRVDEIRRAADAINKKERTDDHRD